MGTIEKFAFIHDEVLRKEVEINYLFIADLNKVFSSLPEKSENEIKRFGYKKMLIILTGSIIEAILLYTIQTLETKHKKSIGIKKIDPRELGILKSGEKLVLYKEVKVKFDPTEITFADMITILGDEFGSHFPKEVCDKLHKMRRLRNGVHVQLKISKDHEFVSMGMYEFYKNAGEIIHLCKQILQL